MLCKKGAYVYYYSKRLGITVPAKVKDTAWHRKGEKLLISGNFPKGDRTVWVHSINCEIQKP